MPRTSLPLVLSFILGLAASTGCATVEVQGRQINESEWQRASKRVTDEASFLFKCAPDKLELKIIDAFQDAMYGDYPTVIGVSGCGDTAIYKRVQAHWVLDGTRSGS